MSGESLLNSGCLRGSAQKIMIYSEGLEDLL